LPVTALDLDAGPASVSAEVDRDGHVGAEHALVPVYGTMASLVAPSPDSSRSRFGRHRTWAAAVRQCSIAVSRMLVMMRLPVSTRPWSIAR